MPFHTIVIEVPDGADPNALEGIITRRIESPPLRIGADKGGMAIYADPKVVEYHHEKMTEDAIPHVLDVWIGQADSPEQAAEIADNDWCERWPNYDVLEPEQVPDEPGFYRVVFVEV